MNGNAWEWCQDYWHDSYVEAPTDGSAWVVGTSVNRVIRSGDWFNSAKFGRSALRLKNNPVTPNYHMGFRVVLDLESSSVENWDVLK